MPQFPFDNTGLATSNLIQNEQHPVTELNYRDFHFIVPTYAPFYNTNFSVSHVNENGVKRKLEEGLDYTLCLEYLAATRATGITAYGGITLASNIVNGVINIDSYQTIGDIWVSDRDYVLRGLADLVYNPRITTWDLVTNVQQIFPPSPHRVQVDDLTGARDLIMSLDSMTTAIGTSRELSNAEIKIRFATMKQDLIDIQARVTALESK